MTWKITIFAILIMCGFTGVLFSQALPPQPWETARAVIPDLGVFGYSTYRLINDSIWLSNGNYPELALCFVIGDVLLLSSSALQISNNLFVHDPDLHRRLLWTTRAGYLASIITTAAWGILHPDLEGEDRVAILVNLNISALIGFGLTFLPYPGRGN